MAERKQISVWISAESAALLQRLADEQSQPKNRIIEWALSAYATSEPTSADTSNLLDWRTDLSNRVLVLETRLEALEAVGAVKIWAVEEKTVNAAVGVEPAIDQSVAQKADIPTGAAEKKESLNDAELDVIVREYLKRSGKKTGKAGELMRQDGISVSQKRLYESKDRIAAADSIKALLER